ncbi:S-layer protein [Candidatus Nanohalovita haloferacivicina]|uniref:S-layer protein n=1 Tax=Candidatus Nanohalovita haloferacivicina TaxID=2978046 RepID=UPI00325FDF95|nr:S-layer protein [Candidatus Nanohalobia archaeon BNXNv]
MKNIKKLKSYGKTVAASALLVGATVTGAAGLAAAQNNGSSGADYTLQDYPAPFVDDEGNVDTSIVVGTDGKQADVVSAVDIAGDLGNQAFSEESVDGPSGASVDGEQLNEEVLGLDLTTTTIDASDYSAFTRTTMEDDDGEDVFVTESAQISGVASRINGTSTDFNVQPGDVTYDVTYSPGFKENDTVTMLGNEYELVNIVDSGEVELGSTMEEDMTVGDSYEHGPYTVEITGQTSGDNSEVVVRVSEGEEVLDTKALEEGETLELDDEYDFSVTASTVIFYSDGTQDVTLESTYTDTTLEEGEDLPMDDRYEVDTIATADSTTTVTGFTLENTVKTVEEAEDEDEVPYVETDQSFAGPADYFSLTNQGITSEAMSTVEFGSEYDLTYTDPNAQEQSLDMTELRTNGDTNISSSDDGTYFAVVGSDKGNDGTSDSYLVEVTDVSTDGTNGPVDAVTLEHASFEQTFETTGTTGSVSTGYGFSVGVTFGANGGDNASITGTTTDSLTVQGGANVSLETNDPSSGGLGIADSNAGSDALNIRISEAEGTDESGADTGDIHVFYDEDDDGEDYFNDADDGEIGAVYYAGAEDEASGTTTNLGDVEDGDETLTHFGSEVVLNSATGAEVMYPDEQRYQVAAFGSTEGGSTNGAVSMTPTGFPAGTGTMDTDVSNSDRSQNMILVGGPEVNDLTADLADEGQTWNSTQYENNQGVGVLDLVNDAFDEGYSALVVAGWNAEDTSAAADYLVNYNADTDTALEGKTTAQVNTDTNELVE